MFKKSKEIKRLKRVISTLETQIKTAIKDLFDSQKPSKSVLLIEVEAIFDYVSTPVPPMAQLNCNRWEPEDDLDIADTTSMMSMAEKFLSNLIPHLAQPHDRGK